MKIAVIGATGSVGSRLVTEALRRGHEVTAIARHADKLAPQPRLAIRDGDVNDSSVSALLKGHDAVISSTRFENTDPCKVIAAVKAAGVPRLLVVGGAGSLEVAPGKALVDTPEFPEAYKREALPGRDFLNALRGEHDLNWTFLSPAAIFAPGERTGKFRVGGDQLLVAADGESKISQEDFAIAMIDEVETPRHKRRRFTVGY